MLLLQNNESENTPSCAAKLPPDFAMGGQAVLEGVMMRGPRRYAIAVRRPQGDIRLTSKPFWPVTTRKPWLKMPIVRGAVSLVEMMLLGYRALDFSARVVEEGQREMDEQENKAAEAVAAEQTAQADQSDTADRSEGVASSPDSPDQCISGWAMAGIFAVSMVLAMGLFVVLPNLTAELIGKFSPGGFKEVSHPLLFNLISGGVRVVIIVLYIWGLSFMHDARRLFQYHGAEHKVVMAFEKGLPLDLEHVRPMTTIHPRCGTAFIAVVLLVSILIFAVLAALLVQFFPGFAQLSRWIHKPIIIALHIVCMPLVAGVAYEFTRKAGRNPNVLFYRVLLAPGMWFQKITTKEPDDSMIEVSLTSFMEALEPEQKEALGNRH
jgi:uncharacterized protein YqhQ